jgi:hypothetical protein
MLIVLLRPAHIGSIDHNGLAVTVTTTTEAITVINRVSFATGIVG